jgi:hypothetical protein
MKTNWLGNGMDEERAVSSGMSQSKKLEINKKVFVEINPESDEAFEISRLSTRRGRGR